MQAIQDFLNELAEDASSEFKEMLTGISQWYFNMEELTSEQRRSVYKAAYHEGKTIPACWYTDLKKAEAPKTTPVVSSPTRNDTTQVVSANMVLAKLLEAVAAVCLTASDEMKELK